MNIWDALGHSDERLSLAEPVYVEQTLCHLQEYGTMVQYELSGVCWSSTPRLLCRVQIFEVLSKFCIHMGRALGPKVVGRNSGIYGTRHSKFLWKESQMECLKVLFKYNKLKEDTEDTLSEFSHSCDQTSIRSTRREQALLLGKVSEKAC